MNTLLKKGCYRNTLSGVFVRLFRKNNIECSGNSSGVLGTTLLKCSQYTLVGVDTGIRTSCMHRNLTIQHKLILITIMAEWILIKR